MKHNNVDSYIASQPAELRAMLEHIRKIIRSVTPDAEEVISYMVPCYKYYGMFVSFGVHKGGCSLYAMNTKILGEFAQEIADKGLKYSGSTIHFDVKKKLPAALVWKLVRARKEQNENKAIIKAFKPFLKSEKKISKSKKQ